MLRFLIKFLLLAIVLVATTLYSAQWKLQQEIKSVARKLQPLVEFDYESAKVNFSGEVSIKSISALVENIGAEIEITELKFYIGNLYQLVFWEENLNKGLLPESAYLLLKGVLIPFNNNLINRLKETGPRTSFDVLDTASCGDIKRLRLEEFDAMGHRYLSFSSDIFYLLDKYSGDVVLNGNMDVEEAYKFDFQTNITGVVSWLNELKENNLNDDAPEQETQLPNISLLEVRVKDQGFLMKKAAYCAAQEKINIADYYQLRANEVKKRLSEVDIQLSDEQSDAYRQLIQPDSQLTVFFQPEKTFKLPALSQYTQQQFITMSGMKLSVNRKSTAPQLNGWSSENFAKIAILEEERKQQLLKSKYKHLVLPRAYQRTSVTQINQFTDYPIRIELNDERVFEGDLVATSNSKLWILLRNFKGEVKLPFAYQDIAKLEVYREVKD